MCRCHGLVRNLQRNTKRIEFRCELLSKVCWAIETLSSDLSCFDPHDVLVSLCSTSRRQWRVGPLFGPLYRTGSTIISTVLHVTIRSSKKNLGAFWRSSAECVYDDKTLAWSRCSNSQTVVAAGQDEAVVQPPGPAETTVSSEITII